jgi:hypothetical protein
MALYDVSHIKTYYDKFSAQNGDVPVFMRTINEPKFCVRVKVNGDTDLARYGIFNNLKEGLWPCIITHYAIQIRFHFRAHMSPQTEYVYRDHRSNYLIKLSELCFDNTMALLIIPMGLCSFFSHVPISPVLKGAFESGFRPDGFLPE